MPLISAHKLAYLNRYYTEGEQFHAIHHVSISRL